MESFQGPREQKSPFSLSVASHLSGGCVGAEVGGNAVEQRALTLSDKLQGRGGHDRFS